MLPIDLTGKIALVTGATGRLGPCLVKTLAKAGADVVVCYQKNKEYAERIASEIEGSGCRAIPVKLDVTNLESVIALKGQVESQLGNVKIVVNNAISQIEWKSVLEQPLSDYSNQFDMCVGQNLNLAKVFGPDMVRLGWGRIISLNTECTSQNYKNQSAYVAGKRAQDGLLRVLARELGPFGVTVNQVAPGWMLESHDKDERQPAWYVNGIPLGRRGRPQEVANVIAFLASDLASYITGACISVSGGNVMTAL